MANKTRIAYYEYATKELLKKGVEQSTIDNLLNGKNTNAKKWEALKPLCEEKGIEIGKKNEEQKEDNSPTLQSYFGKRISDLLIERKKLINLSLDKEIDKEKLETTKLSELSDKERKHLIEYINYNGKEKQLEEIDNKLREKGLIYNPTKKGNQEQETINNQN